ncbi:RsmE family RNA methyltransferase [Parasporobacterium paucivorans]|uniref:Ribosomal RNA small subunit methyltransferase E n=1 Tax=Parasporobacterium paucivorans DSM 15970 TaxID=1122934 RepID=A0A1M6C0V1_9FIRM|nr:RsmE family RNA methyltransferase [Parasporobacterium paucivorans]SHI54665.1 16S rRNA (uracil1498-N3)-methyltransferase [Parasporobacterium paucivorans DSM 15970]
MYHFFVDSGQVKEKEITLTGPDVNHIRNVLRMSLGEEILISDGTGGNYKCRIRSLENDRIVADILENGGVGNEPGARFYLFQGVPKSDKMELIIQKAVELGVYEIIPVFTKRSVVKLDEKKREAKLKRYNAISESAAKQSGREIIPKVNSFMTFKEALAYAGDFSINIIPYENFKDMNATRTIFAQIENGMSVGIFIGPEGGFDGDEIIQADGCGVKQISLGKRILRTETAGMAVLSILMFNMEK